MAKKKESAEGAMLTAVADFLKSKGWRVVVIGGVKIQKQPHADEFQYEFVVGFTGGPPTDSDSNNPTKEGD